MSQEEIRARIIADQAAREAAAPIVVKPTKKQRRHEYASRPISPFGKPRQSGFAPKK